MALRLEPKNAIALFNSGVVFRKLGKAQEAHQVWVRLIQETPPSQVTALAQVELAKVQLISKTPEGILRAVRLFQGAAKADPNLMAAQEGLEESLFESIMASLPIPAQGQKTHPPKAILDVAELAKRRGRCVSWTCL